jgi:hypothetical protein
MRVISNYFEMTNLAEADLNESNLDFILEPVDWSHLYRLAKLTPGQRMLAMSQASAFARSILCGSFRQRYPNCSLTEINMLMLESLKTRPEYSRWTSYRIMCLNR